MSVYNNEEEQARRGLKVGEGSVSAPLAGSKSYKAVKNIIGIARKGKEEADRKKSLAGKVGSYARAAATFPVAIGAPVVDEARRDIGSVYRSAKSFGRALVGSEEPQSNVAPTMISPGAVPATTSPPQAAPPSPIRIAPAAKATSPINALKSRAGEDSGMPGTGYITSRTGAVGIGADGKVIMKGKPLPLSKAPARAPARRKSRMTTYGGYRLPEREQAKQDTSLRRVSDIAAPKTIGAVPGHRREVEAARFDIAAEQKERDRAQRQSQFGAGQEQQQEQFEAGQEQQHGQFSARQGLDERRVTGAEQQQQLAAAQQKAKLAADQRREGREVSKEAEISAARAKFEAADTAAEKVAAAQMLNSLQGMKINAPTKGKSPGLTQKETSQQVQGALKAFEGAGGEAAAGTDFYTWMRQNDTRGYQAAFGNLTPKDIRDHARIQELTDEQIMSSDLPGIMRPGETPAQFRQRLDVEYRSKRGY